MSSSSPPPFRNSDSASNYVDRVRIRDSSSSFGGPGRGSGWRQKSLSNIDLPTSYRGIAGGVAGTGGLVGAGQFRYRDYDSGLYDLYSRIDSHREEYDDLYGVNPKASRAASSVSVSSRHKKQQQHQLEHQQQAQDKDQQRQSKHHHHHHHRGSAGIHHQEFYNPESNEACSLRRTRSLAVIREESYNDLHLHGRGARRSQLIPRAKLVDRNFFKERYNFIYDDCEATEPPDNEAQYVSKRFSAQGQPFPWHTDKSDLDSIDSSIFKHSLHQQNSYEGSLRNSVRSGDSTKFVSKVEVHSEYSGASKSETGIEADIKHLDDISIKEEPPRAPSKNSTLETIKKRFPLEGKRPVREEEESGITIIEIKDSQVSHKSSSVISYDSIYLSSESDEKEVLDDLLPDVRITEESDLIDIKIEDYDDLFKETDLEKAESTIDTLYGQVTKPKPKIVAVEPKIQPNDSLKRYIKNTSRGTIERLSIISNLKLRQEFADSKSQPKEKPLHDHDYQYNSLPDAADVCKILRNSERIDAKLRRICDNEQSGRSTRAESDHFDSLPRLDKSSLNLTQPPSDEDASLEESDKGAPSIEVVETPTREVLSHASSKVYLKDFGLELDYENSVVTNSDQDSDITIVAPQETIPPEIVVTPAEKPTRKHTHEEPVIYSTFASTVGKHTTNRINFENKEKPKPKAEAIAEVKTKLKPVPVIVDESPKKPIAQAPTVKLGGKKVIVDEVAAKAAKREKELEQIVKVKTPVENRANAVVVKKPSVKKSVEAPVKKEETKPEPIPIVNTRPPDPKPPEQKEGSPKVDHSSLFKDTNPFKEQARREVKNRVVDRPLFKGVRRFNSTENIYTSAPIIVTKTFNNFIKTNEVKTKSFDSLIVENNNEKKKEKMPRPQVIQIVDSKQNLHNGSNGTPRKAGQNGQQIQKEFLHKVDSVRNYWSRMLDEADAREDDEDQVDSGSSPKEQNGFQQSKNGEGKPDKLGSSSSTEQQQHQQPQAQPIESQKKSTKRQNSSRNKYSTYQIDEATELQSFSPTVEIIELDGHKQAALVKPKNAQNLDFDHVRYKVMKSEMFQKNLLVNHRKAAQFDGLMQYLQDYSFQELLAHNNVVIIEPVRTKIEKISDKPPQSVAATCRITTGALPNGEQKSNKKGSGLRKHFFYHPIRVNKELLDEELPSPDTVRNVRKLFEGTLRLGTSAKQAYEDAKANGGIRKWDSASLSSGVSSGDLSSPCECGENEIDGDFAEENLIGDDELESHYVSQDVLEKIRECGSTVTYYGGRVVDKKGEHVSTMTKAIMKEIRGQERKSCQVCQPNGCRGQQGEVRRHSANIAQSDKLDGLGVKFKLVKSNSCSSRLELAGTGKTPPDLMKNQHGSTDTSSGRPKLPKPSSDGSSNSTTHNELKLNQSELPPSIEEPEESVRDLVSRLESHTPLSVRSKPRIIESKCIEKTDEGKAEPTAITINNQSMEVVTASIPEEPPMEEPPQTGVTVNNHITVPGQLLIPSLLKGQKAPEPPAVTDHRPPKVCRNKNVDLAFSATITKASNKPAKEKENLARKSSLVNASTADTIDSLELISAAPVKTVTFKDDENNNRGEIEQHENLKPSVIAEQRKSDELTSPKLVNWSLLGTTKFDERQYFANDKKLIEKRKYDDMEFEEFEVLDPNGVVQQQQQQQQQKEGECYDSLNSGK